MSAVSWARVVARVLVRAGLRRAVLSPGSRSTPLVLALEELRREGRVTLEVVIDERAAAFFALGAARATGEASLLVATSGSAPGHWLPALIEASHARLPLVALSADRPLELADCGASQTVRQPDMFGSFVRGSWDLGAPDDAPAALEGLARRVMQAVALTQGPEPGPVHLDARFRKPLEGAGGTIDEAERVAAAAPRVEAPRAVASARALAEVRERFARSRRPLVVAGPACPPGPSELGAILGVARVLGAPILSEPTSNLASTLDPRVLPHLDPVVRAGAVEAYDPDLIVEVGLPPVSSAYAELAAAWGARRVVLTGTAALADPTNVASLVVLGAFDALTVGNERPLSPSHPIVLASSVASEVARMHAGDELSEGAAVASVVGALEGDGDLLLGNSCVVRDVDAFAPRVRARVLHQRGAAGIDGLVAGAAGGAAASGRGTVCLLGDVSFAHDASALAVASRLKTPLVLVVVDNGGGRVFERLPARRALETEAFERLYATPPSLDLEALARAYGVTYAEADEPAGVARAVGDALRREGSTLVVARTRPSARSSTLLAERTREALRVQQARQEKTSWEETR